VVRPVVGAFRIFVKKKEGMTRRYPAKLLVFGEYSLLRGSRALCVPLREFAGHWAVRGADTPTDHPLVGEWIAYLEREVEFLDNGALREAMVTEYFESSIPVGYGLGSSGALCAAVYDRFGLDEVADIGVLKSRFAKMEQFFHGSSSGLDPLTSYLEQPLLVDGIDVRPVEMVASNRVNGRLFLLDSGRGRLTGPLVAQFLEQCRQPAFEKMCRNELAPAVDVAIRAFLGGQLNELEDQWARISGLQLSYFRQMIPDDLMHLWSVGIESRAFSLKLCGAGGGGFFLGLRSEDKELPILPAGMRVLYPVL
jgi:mevalonate kinase